MKSRKTWFLPPDFTFLPDGQIALGRVIPEPRRPTATLASLADHPTIALPEVKSIVETRSFSDEKNRSFGFELFANFLGIASANAKIGISRYKDKSFSTADHEVQTYNGAFTPETLKAIVELDRVKKHIDSGRFGKRCAYIISGLRIAQQSFTVTDTLDRTTELALGGSGPVGAGVTPAELGATVSGSQQTKKTRGYETAPGIVFAYRLHVIRVKSIGEEGELFSDRTAFFSGGSEDDEAEEMEIVEVDAAALQEDLDLPPDAYDERTMEDADGSYIVFKPVSKQ
ncbi:hypothetical protein F4861DRAFT_62881 [Xylaria intraflava]|nr:hypothetical protein F4861DRAFT_62881 [Xylaria intraflava]